MKNIFLALALVLSLNSQAKADVIGTTFNSIFPADCAGLDPQSIRSFLLNTYNAQDSASVLYCQNLVPDSLFLSFLQTWEYVYNTVTGYVPKDRAKTWEQELNRCSTIVKNVAKDELEVAKLRVALCTEERNLSEAVYKHKIAELEAKHKSDAIQHEKDLKAAKADKERATEYNKSVQNRK